MFIQLDNKYGDKIINTDKVTNVVIEDEKFIFNFDYSVSLQHNKAKIIPDYAYLTATTDDEFNYLDDAIASLGWISHSYPHHKAHSSYNTNDNWHIINPNGISNVKFTKTNRIIFNFGNSVSVNRENDKYSASFVYFDYDDIESFEADKTRIKNILTNHKKAA